MIKKTVSYYEVKYCIRFPYHNDIVDKETGLDYFCLSRTKTFHDYNKALAWAKKWCPYGFCITTFTCMATGEIKGYIENFLVEDYFLL